jgi:hypothetical protein
MQLNMILQVLGSPKDVTGIAIYMQKDYLDEQIDDNPTLTKSILIIMSR